MQFPQVEYEEAKGTHEKYYNQEGVSGARHHVEGEWEQYRHVVNFELVHFLQPPLNYRVLFRCPACLYHGYVEPIQRLTRLRLSFTFLPLRISLLRFRPIFVYVDEVLDQPDNHENCEDQCGQEP